MKSIISQFLLIKRKKKILESYGWYRNMHGGWTHSHGVDYMTSLEIWSYTPEELEYKIQHGSQARVLK